MLQEAHNIARFSQSSQQKPLSLKGTTHVPQLLQNYARNISILHALKVTFLQFIYSNKGSELKLKQKHTLPPSKASSSFHWQGNKAIFFFSFLLSSPIHPYLLTAASGCFQEGCSCSLHFKVTPLHVLSIIAGKGGWFSKASFWCLMKLSPMTIEAD